MADTMETKERNYDPECGRSGSGTDLASLRRSSSQSAPPGSVRQRLHDVQTTQGWSLPLEIVHGIVQRWRAKLAVLTQGKGGIYVSFWCL